MRFVDNDAQLFELIFVLVDKEEVKRQRPTKRIWNHAFLLGIGRKFRMNTRLEMTVILVFDVLH
jgi:hypothetical protein